MDESRAREILGDAIQTDGSLYRLRQYTKWELGDTEIMLDGEFSCETLEAVVWWMRHAPMPVGREQIMAVLDRMRPSMPPEED